MIDKEHFEEWLAHPVTEHVLRRVGELAEANRLKWCDQSWSSGIADQTILIDLKARAEAAKDLSELKYEDVKDEESKPNKAD